ncbi:AraC family transcriptional regulator [Bacteroides helcogenes]|uniref:Helix-turn-helix, AraC domain protein n=1 Tax=Bacteroides helcogenes (strain ATCC 35417 / DSM 20613 / JCM 6297 / CCUG 15421 / P 36-108) TaxID=693979 RepID=E6SPW9_BACT6|nr:AraC family transcriptional regulator [Bacteroides helcogenes]ADV44948.1 Helix-turn-helix, AraC domain protein [Bacteroides helcogenes P 36-108]MDY5239804.1 AraC family transcriptional regulator [Bacteroides helcogenes]
MNSDIIIYNCMDTFYCCHVDKDRLCEEMVTDHMLVYICSGEMDLIAPEKTYKLKKGDYLFIKKDHMMRKIKHPSKDGEPFKGLFLQLKRPFLKSLMSEVQIAIPMNGQAQASASYTILPKHPFLQGLFASLEQYFSIQQYPSEELMNIKLKEAVFALLQVKPEIACVLFDFTDPWKIDLEGFMMKNYKCDLSLEEFAHFTGRSLSTFKTDFFKLFRMTPSRWINKKRLEEAKYLIESKKAKPSDVYPKVGFKNFSHFSTAFKKEYGAAPSFYYAS